jgi:hypothetical protein
MSPGPKRKAARATEPSLEVQVRELRNDVNRIIEAVGQIETAITRSPCWPGLCWWIPPPMCGPANMPGQMCGPPGSPGNMPGQMCGPPQKRRKRK